MLREAGQGAGLDGPQSGIRMMMPGGGGASEVETKCDAEWGERQKRIIRNCPIVDGRTG